MKIKITDIATAQIHTGYQFRQRVEAEPDGTHFYIQIRDIDAGLALTPETLIKVTPRQDADNYLVRKGDVLFVARGQRNHAIALTHEIADTIAASHFFIIRPDAARMLPEYLAWYINLEQGSAQEYLHNIARRGSHMPLIPISAFRDMDVELPPMDTQRAIVMLSRLQRTERRLTDAINKKRTALINTACMKAVRSATSSQGDHDA